MVSRQMRIRKRRAFLAGGCAAGLALAGVVSASAFAVAGTPSGFKVSRIGLAVGSGLTEPDSVAADPATSTAYVAVGGGNDGILAVIDTTTNTMTRIINLGHYLVLDVAVNPQTDTVYAYGYYNHPPSPHSAVFVIDGKTGKVAATIAMPQTFAYLTDETVDPATNTIYASSVSNSITVIDGATNKITGSISVASASSSFVYSVAADPATDTIYAIGSVTISGARKDALWTINGQTQAVTGPLDLGAPAPEKSTCVSPHGVAVNPATDTVYTATGQSLQVIDGATSTVTATVAVAASDVGVDQSTGLVYAMSPQATEVIGGASNSVISSFPRGGCSAAADPATSTVYISSEDAIGDVWVVTPSTATVFSPDFGGALGARFFTVGAAGSYSLPVSASPAATFSYVGTLPRGLRFSTGGVLAGTPAPATGGQYYIQVTATNGIDPPATDPLAIVVKGPPVITSRPEATFRTGVLSSFFVQVTGYPSAFSFAETGALPTGVGFDPVGELLGTPAAGTGGRYKIHITVSNAGGSATQAFTLTVAQKPQFISAARAVFTTGVKGQFMVVTTGFPAARLTESGHLPKGLAFRARPHGRALIVGTPASSARSRYVITITARTSAGQSARQRFVIRVH